MAGLHIGIVMRWALAFSRLAFAASEHASLHWPTKRLAALAALAAGSGYMVLTGLHVPIVRSFAMAALYTIAVLAGRRAISLRGLAAAATVLILAEPEKVLGVSFQMSFAAVLALIAGYESLRPWLRSLREGGLRWRRCLIYVAALALTSSLAGTTLAPFAAYYFGRIQIYFIAANIVAVPIVGLWAMPAGLIALALMPIGLDRGAFVVMGWGTRAILTVAHTVASWPAAAVAVPHTAVWGLAATGQGIAWLGLWRNRMRLAGIPLIAFGLLSPLLLGPPDLLVSDDARLIAVRSPDTMILQAVSGFSRFTREEWLQYWAPARVLAMPQDGEAVAGVVACDGQACLLRPAPDAKAALLVRGAIHPEGCEAVSVIVSAEPARGLCPHPWPALVDRFTVWQYGATAIWLEGGHARILTDRSNRGERPWVPPLPVRRPHRSPALPPAREEADAQRELAWLSVAAQQRHHPALHLDAVRREDARLVTDIARLECNRIAAPADTLQRHFGFIHQGHNDLPGFRGFALADDHGVAVEDTGLDHRIAGDLECVMFAAAQHVNRHVDKAAGIAQRFDRQAGGDPAIQRKLDRGRVVGRAHAGYPGGEVAADHIRRERRRGIFARPFAPECRKILRQPQHLQRPRPMPPAAEEAALFEGRNQPVNAGFRLQAQRILHLLEARRETSLFEMPVNIHQQLVLLAREHGAPHSSQLAGRRYRSEQTGN